MTVLVFFCIEHTVVTDFNKMASLFAGRNSASGYLAYTMACIIIQIDLRSSVVTAQIQSPPEQVVLLFVTCLLLLLLLSKVYSLNNVNVYLFEEPTTQVMEVMRMAKVNGRSSVN